MKRFYHGSVVPELTQLEARSRLHTTQQPVVYLTDCVPYALFYIWDTEHNGFGGKYVTARVENNVAFYEEQFSDQLRTFYQGVSGYLYCVSDSADIKLVEGRENLFYCTHDVAVSQTLRIDDVYRELQGYEAEATLRVARYDCLTSPQKERIIRMISEAIVREDFYNNDPVQREFMKKHFRRSWKLAQGERRHSSAE